MRKAKLFDGVTPEGAPYFAPDRARFADEAERDRVADFLAGGTVIRRTTATDPDRWDPELDGVVSLDTATDGTWIWSTAWHYYVSVHGLKPEPDFLAHIRSCAYLATTPDDAARQAALTQLRG